MNGIPINKEKLLEQVKIAKEKRGKTQRQLRDLCWFSEKTYHNMKNLERASVATINKLAPYMDINEIKDVEAVKKL